MNNMLEQDELEGEVLSTPLAIDDEGDVVPADDTPVESEEEVVLPIEDEDEDDDEDDDDEDEDEPDADGAEPTEDE